MNLRNKKTKIVATLGPRSETIPVLEAMIRSGLNVARANMSHGTHAEHSNRIATFRKAGENVKKRVALLVDLAGPKIRVGVVEGEPFEIKTGESVIFEYGDFLSTRKKISVNYPNFASEMKKGNRILIEDGKLELAVVEINGSEVRAKVVVGGYIKSKKGLNLPGAYLSVKALTEKDKKDTKFAVEQNADFVALSFVRTAKDIDDLRKLLKKLNSKAQIIAKIETQEAIAELESIVMATDAVMIARGDLAVEIYAEKVPIEQRRMIELSRKYGKPVIVATQMMDSMERSPVPTRAEVSDVATAVWSGADAVMLSGESSIGDYPVETVAMMSKIIQNVENSEYGYGHSETPWLLESTTDVVIQNAITMARDVNAKAIVSFTATGSTVRNLARYRTDIPIIGVSAETTVCNQMVLQSGVKTIQTNIINRHWDEVAGEIEVILKNRMGYKKGDQVVITAGWPFGVPGSTNGLFVWKIA